MTHSMGSSSAPTCAPHTPLKTPPRYQMPHPQAAPLLWPTGLHKHPSRRVTERLKPLPLPPQLESSPALRAAPGAYPMPQPHLWSCLVFVIFFFFKLILIFCLGFL
jgi:hypothetical protein